MSIFTNSKEISKSLVNFAAKRGIEFEIYEGKLLVWGADNDSEWLCDYLINENGSLSFNANVTMKQQDKEELPGTIFDAKKLKEMIVFISSTLA